MRYLAKAALRGKFADIPKMEGKRQRKLRKSRGREMGDARESAVPEAKGRKCFKKEVINCVKGFERLIKM